MEPDDGEATQNQAGINPSNTVFAIKETATKPKVRIGEATLIGGPPGPPRRPQWFRCFLLCSWANDKVVTHNLFCNPEKIATKEERSKKS